ncbi:MFS transporter, CP family, cyanate transporter [Thalassobacillus cyri]|uniref:MFS transporter, CP family, cyanate transporter n=1 Tax=Thalassobacillus cyri TaxID=571932 RepID=A0A1H3XQV2_9BACI|nr:MFS transporter [Thalassobacillus cyri]SEA01835.1 MFS transporter, CP family, cyanate transporter [Thalassobacillus cyri]
MKKQPPQTKKILLIIGIMFVAFNLRPAITGVGPLISSIRTDLGISYGAAGFITTLPLISFAVFSFLAPKLGNRFGYERMVFMGLVTLMIGIAIRYIATAPTLYTGTALVGIGIAISNVLLPGIIKDRYPGRIGLMTAVYTTSMSVFSAVGSGLSIPLAKGLGLGWENALFAWVLLALIAAFLWIPQLSRPVKKDDKQTAGLGGPPIWKSKIAWQVTIFMGLQSFLFYSLITWLPEIMTGKGLGIAAAGLMVSTMQLSGLPMTFLTPVLADRFRNQRGLIIMIGTLYLTGLTGMLVSTSTAWLTGSVMLMGMGQASSISLALTLLGLRAANARESAALSGMAQSFGYALAAIGPTMIGIVIDVSATVNVPIIIFICILIMMVLAGFGAARDQTIFERQTS